jgi:arabinose-5-phosphate isomerase
MRVQNPTISTERVISQGREVLRIEAEALLALVDRLDSSFEAACRLILACEGRVVVTGIGKSGHVARKIASTLASTGTLAFFVHSAEAMHGDLGMVTAGDVVIALSNSGSTEEVLSLVPAIKRGGAKLIAMTGNPDSELAKVADVHLNAAVSREACSLNLAPTASTTAALALGDALAVALLDARGFGAEDFARSHPGGALGRRLLTHVRDVMHHGDALPRVAPEVSLSQAILEISNKRLGMVAVMGSDERLLGVLTDGDLRRLFERGVDPHKCNVSDVMSKHPVTISESVLAVEAAQLMEARSISKLAVVDREGRCVGALQVNDLLIAKVI